MSGSKMGKEGQMLRCLIRLLIPLPPPPLPLAELRCHQPTQIAQKFIHFNVKILWVAAES